MPHAVVITASERGSGEVWKGQRRMLEKVSSAFLSVAWLPKNADCVIISIRNRGTKLFLVMLLFKRGKKCMFGIS